jgi:hypothetical protein
MPDITALLERAAAEPTSEPDVARCYQRALTRRRALWGTSAVVVATAVIVGGIIAVRSDSTARIQVGSPPSTSVPTEVYRDAEHRFSITLPAGWQRAPSLAPWLHSPYDILDVATVPLQPSLEPGNQAACPAEVPKVAVAGLGRTGAYLSIREWRPGEGMYTAQPRPARAADLRWGVGACELASGAVVSTATFSDQGRDFSVTMVTGAESTAPVALMDILDSFVVEPRS